RSDQEATRSDREATRSDREATRSDREATRSDREATRSDREATRSDREATRSDRDAIRPKSVSASGSVVHTSSLMPDSALPALLQALDEGVLIFDEHGICRAAGRRAAEILGLDAVVGLPRPDVVA